MTQSRRMSLVEAATNVIVGYALAIYLAISGAFQTFSSLFNHGAAGSKTDRIRGLVGLIGGGLLLALTYFDILAPSAGYVALAVLLIAYGVLGLFEVLFDRGDERFGGCAVHRDCNADRGVGRPESARHHSDGHPRGSAAQW